MNLKRGLFRIWVVFSVVWIVGALSIAISDTKTPSLMNPCSDMKDWVYEDTGKPIGDAEKVKCAQLWDKEKWEIAGNIFLPPLGLLAVWLTGSWVVSGFRGTKAT